MKNIVIFDLIHNEICFHQIIYLFHYLILDNIIRLRRQQQHIFDSDEDDDDDDENTRTSSNNRIISPLPTIQPIKKLNGVRRTNDLTGVEHHHSSNGITQNEAQPLTSTASIQSASSAITNSTTSTNLPQTNGNGSISNRRRPPTSAFAYNDNYSSHSNSRLSMSNSDDLLDSSASSSNELITNERNLNTEQVTTNPLESTPVKKRKLAIADYINKRSHSELNGAASLNEHIEENNNEQNNNNTICPPNCHMNLEQASTSSAAARRANFYNNTPDSGVSVSTLTPNHTDDDVSSRFVGGSGGAPRHILQNTNSQTAVHVFQQKVARVRRNYRKKFAEESDSD